MIDLPAAASRLLKPSILQKTLILVFVPLGVNCVWINMLSSSLAKTEEIAEKEHKLVLIVDQLNATESTFLAVLSEIYSYSDSGRVAYRASAQTIINKSRGDIAKLNLLLADAGETKACGTHFDLLVEKCLLEANSPAAAGHDRDYNDIIAKMKSIRKLIRALKGDNDELQNILQDYKQRLEKLRQSELGSRSAAQSLIRNGLLANFILALVLLGLFMRNIGGRLAILIDNATRLPKRLELNQRVSGADELSYLDGAMHLASHELVQAWNHRDALIAMVAHDLRSPLNSCEISLEMLQEIEGAHLSAEGNSQINNVRSNIRRLVALINDLLTINKLEAGELALDKKIMPIKEVADAAIASLQTLADSRQIAIQNLCTDQTMLADRDRILQVLINYLSNAIKFSSRQTSIQISCVEERSRLTVSVQDHGKGLSKAESRRVFEKFYQAKSDQSVKGFGLGLAICKLIIESHGGLVGVESSAGAGSRFWFSVEAGS